MGRSLTPTLWMSGFLEDLLNFKSENDSAREKFSCWKMVQNHAVFLYNQIKLTVKMKLSLVFVGAVFGEQCYEVCAFWYRMSIIEAFDLMKYICEQKDWFHKNLLFRVSSIKQAQLSEQQAPMSLKL